MTNCFVVIAPTLSMPGDIFLHMRMVIILLVSAALHCTEIRNYMVFFSHWYLNG